MKLEVVCDGTWLTTLGRTSGLEYSTVADGGSEQASWQMDLSPAFNHPALNLGNLVEIMNGPHPIWSGVLSEPDRGDIRDVGWSLSAVGIKGDGQRYFCFDEDENTTSKPDLAIDQAIARGLRWKRPASLSNDDFAVTGETDALNKVNDLIDALALTRSERWGVNGQREVYMAPDPTTPTWYMTPGSGKLGLADDDYASDIYVRYQSGATTFATVHVFDPTATDAYRAEAAIDATNHGVITAPKATAIGQGAIDRGKARYSLTNPFNPSRFQITTPGGTPAPLALVKGGDMVRLFGVTNQQGLLMPYFDFIIGRTQYAEGSNQIMIAPVELAARSLGDVLQEAVA